MTPRNANADQTTLDSFYEADETTLPVIDRSTLERYASCPAQARYVESGRVNNSSLIAATGEEVHKAFGNVLDEYIQSQGSLSRQDIMQALENWLGGARPDVQPDAIAAARPILWDWSNLIASTHAANILRYDGGSGERSGQLSADIAGLARITSELDLLYAGPSKAVLHEIDYKSGWKQYTPTDVASSFQFQVHWFLVAAVYPKVEALEVRVWNSRIRKLTRPVEFDRSQMSNITSRIRTAAGYYVQFHAKEPELTEAWPAVEKCPLCPAAAVCPKAGEGIKDIATDPGRFVDEMFATDQKLAAMQKMAGAYVEQHGDIYGDSGAAFGINKPVSTRKPSKTLYVLPNRGSDEA